MVVCTLYLVLCTLTPTEGPRVILNCPLQSTRYKAQSTNTKKSRAKQRGTSIPLKCFGSSVPNSPSCLAVCFTWPQVALTHHVFKDAYSSARQRVSRGTRHQPHPRPSDKMKPAAEQRSELSPGRGFASPGVMADPHPEPRSGDRVALMLDGGSNSVAAPQLRLICLRRDPGLAKPRPGLSSDRCSAAPAANYEPSKSFEPITQITAVLRYDHT
jgi:hypothetical protein